MYSNAIMMGVKTMSLFIHYNDPRLLRIAQNVFSEQFLRDPKLSSELDDRRKQLMYDDILYNLSYLFTAIHFEDVKIFEHYAVWLYELLCNLMKDFDRDRIMEQMNGSFKHSRNGLGSRLFARSNASHGKRCYQGSFV